MYKQKSVQRTPKFWKMKFSIKNIFSSIIQGSNDSKNLSTGGVNIHDSIQTEMFGEILRQIFYLMFKHTKC